MRFFNVILNKQKQKKKMFNINLINARIALKNVTCEA